MTIGGLGSGLDFLYDENAADVQVKKTLRVSELEPNRDQPRKESLTRTPCRNWPTPLPSTG